MVILISCWNATVLIEGGQPDLLEEVKADFGPFCQQSTTLPEGAPRISVHRIDAHKPDWRWLLPTDAALSQVDPTGPMTQWRTDTAEYLLWENRYAVVRSEGSSRTEVYLPHGVPAYPIVRSELVQALRRGFNQAGYLVLHAGLVAHPGSGVAFLLPATKGSGKTSACLLCGAAGFDILTDEITVLLDPGSPLATGLPRRFGMTDATIARFFPDQEISTSAEFQSPLDGRSKHLVRPPGLVTGVPPTVQLTGILLPKIWRSNTCRMEPWPIERVQVDLFEAAGANDGPRSRLFAAAGHLARQLPAYRLLMGQATEANVAALSRLLNSRGLAGSTLYS